MATSNVTSVPWLTSTTGTGSNASTSAKSADILGKDDFLKLLITELQHQDPTDPMKDREFISQMASFSSLEQMQNMSTGFTSLKNTITSSLIPNLQLQQASSLIGQAVCYSGTNEDGSATTLSGIVDMVVVDNGTAYCVVNGTKVDPSKISAIAAVSNNQINQLISKIDDLMYILLPEEGAESDS